MTEVSKSDVTKRLLANVASRIELDDFVSAEVGVAIERLGSDRFPLSAPVAEGSLSKRLAEYEEIIEPLLPVVVLLAKWARDDQLRSLRKLFSRLGSAEKGSAGVTLWVRLNWYPIQVLMYAAGIAALEAENYDALAAVLLASCRVQNSPTGEIRVPILQRVTDEMTQISDSFKAIPKHERHRVPRSEYLFEWLKAPLERELFLGSDYEELFDRFEVLAGLIYADLTAERRGGVWGPIGRFGYKYARDANDPYAAVVAEAEAQKDRWPILKAGFFEGDSKRFGELSKAFAERLSKLGWW